MMKSADNHGSVTVKVHAKEFVIPPVRDALVVGKTSPIGCVALKKALTLLHGEPFEDIHPDDEVVGDILIRANILRKVSRDKLERLVLERIKPLMVPGEVIHLDIEVEVFLEHQV